MRTRDSFLHFLVRLGIHESHPELAERLALEDIAIPNMKHCVEMAELLHAMDAVPSADAQPDAQQIADKTKATEPVRKSSPPPRSPWNPRQYLQRRYRESVLKELNQPGDCIDYRYKGLTDLEKGVALSHGGFGATVAGKGHFEGLDSWLADVTKREGIVKPRLIIVESDFPNAGELYVPGEQPAVFVTTNLVELLNERQLKAMLGHELGHLKEHQGKGVVSRMFHRLYNGFRLNMPRFQEEYRADAFGAHVTGGPEDMVDALRIIAERFMEVEHFARQASSVCDAFNLDVEALFPVSLKTIVKGKQLIFPPTTAAERRKATAEDPHPPYVSRFDALFEKEQFPRSTSQGRER